VLVWRLRTLGEMGRFDNQPPSDRENRSPRNPIGVAYMFSYPRRFAITAWDRELVQWNVNSPQVTSEVNWFVDNENGHRSAIEAFTVSSETPNIGTRQRILAGTADGWLLNVEYATGAILREEQLYSPDVQFLALAFSPDANSAIVAASDGSLKMWDVSRIEDLGDFPTPTPAAGGSSSSAPLASYEGNAGMAQALDFAPDAKRFASGSDTGVLAIWDVETHSPQFGTDRHEGAITDLVYNRTGTRILTASTDRTIKLWDVTGERPVVVATLRQHSAAVTSVDFADEGFWAASGSADGTVVLWKLYTSGQGVAERSTTDAATINAGEAVRIFEGHTSGVIAVDFNGIGTRIISADAEGTIIQWRFDDDLQEFLNEIRGRYRPVLTCLEQIQFNIDTVCPVEATTTPTLSPTPTPYQTATWTPTPTPTATYDEATTSPTFTPEPTGTLPLSDTRAPDSIIATLAANGVLDSTRGYLAEWLDAAVVNMSNGYNTSYNRSLDQERSYTDFVLRTTLQWGPGAQEDRCGFTFRRLGNDNYYIVEVNRYGEVFWGDWTADEWQTPDNIYPADGTFTEDLDTDAGDSNELVLVGHDNQFSLYINGALNGYARASVTETLTSHDSGRVRLRGTIFNESSLNYCTFTDTWVWDAVNTKPPEPTPTPTSPAPVAATPGISRPDEVIQALVLNGTLPRVRGYLAETGGRLLLDMTTETDETISGEALSANSLDYEAFAVSTTIGWGPGAANDQCGVILMYSLDNYYHLSIDRLGVLRLDELEDNIWDDTRFGNGDSIELDFADTNTLLIVVTRTTRIENTDTNTAIDVVKMVVFINGEYAGEFQDESHLSGSVLLSGATFKQSEGETSCTFTDNWIWDLGRDEAPTPVPTAIPHEQTTPLAPGISVTSALLTPGAREEWLYDGLAGQEIRIVANASRPADGVPDGARQLRGLMNIEVIVRRPDGGVLALGNDIDPGVATNVIVDNLILPVDGRYEIEVYDAGNLVAGSYELSVEVLQTHRLTTATPEIVASPSLTLAALSSTPTATDAASSTLTPTPPGLTPPVDATPLVPSPTLTQAAASAGGTDALRDALLEVDSSINSRSRFTCDLYMPFYTVLEQNAASDTRFAPFIAPDAPLLRIRQGCAGDNDFSLDVDAYRAMKDALDEMQALVEG
jgi:hypothetical protein